MDERDDTKVDPPKYSLEWLRRNRPGVMLEMSRLATATEESPALKRRRARLAELMGEIRDAGEYIAENCPHVMENQRYTEHGLDSAIGDLPQRVDHVITCEGCGQKLVAWTT